MQAVQHDRYGGGPAGLKHVDVPVPSPNADEVLLKLEVAALNPLDCKLQKGMLRPFLPPRFPHIPGTDVAGEVVGLGSEVQNFKIGDKVVAMLSLTDGGGLAEFVSAKENLTVAKPQEVSASEGAALCMAGLSRLTAHQALTQSAGIKLGGSG